MAGDDEEESEMIEKQTSRGTKGGVDLRALRDAIRGGDPDALLGFYAEDAELRVVNAALPRGASRKLKGKDQIAKYLRANRDGGASRKLKGGAVFGERGLAFVEECRYPDGGAVSVETMLEVEGGLIVRQTDVVGEGTTEGRGG